MSVRTFDRLGTVMGRALAQRGLDLAAAFATSPGPEAGGRVDLTRPAEQRAPEHVRAAAAAALDRGETHYTSRPGIPELRRGIARRLTEEGFPADAETVVVTNGGTEALYIVLQTVLRPGDRIAVVAPVPRHVTEMIRFIGAEPVPVAGLAAERFLPPAESIAAAEAAALLLLSPSPVTGVALRPEPLARIVEAARARGTTVVLDRSLATALYDPALARFDRPDLGAAVFTVGSFSTGHGLAGWRAGFFSAPEGRVKQLRELKQAMSICTTSVSQYAALAALEGPDGWLAERRAAFAARRDRVAAFAREHGLGIVEPDAYPASLLDVGRHDADDRRVAGRWAEAGAIVGPGSDLDAALAGFVRIDLGAGDATLDAGLARIAAALKGQTE